LQGLGKFTAGHRTRGPNHAGALRGQREIKQQPIAWGKSMQGAADASARERQVIHLKQKSAGAALSFDDDAKGKAFLVARANADIFFCCISHECEGLVSTC